MRFAATMAPKKPSHHLDSGARKASSLSSFQSLKKKFEKEQKNNKKLKKALAKEKKEKEEAQSKWIELDRELAHERETQQERIADGVQARLAAMGLGIPWAD